MENSLPERKIATVILAAGNSSRLGQPKQLVEFQGMSLLERAIESVRSSVGPNITVVLGGNIVECREILKSQKVKLIENPNWKEGMGNSLKCGIQAVIRAHQDRELPALLICLCDQPLIPKEYYKKMVETFWKNGKGSDSQFDIVATDYGKMGGGAPAIFSPEKIASLLELDDRQGAKPIIQQENNKHLLKCAEASFDIDTSEDLEKLNLLQDK